MVGSGGAGQSIRHVPPQSSYRQNLRRSDLFAASRSNNDSAELSVVHSDTLPDLLSSNNLKQSIRLIEEFLNREISYPDLSILPISNDILWGMRSRYELPRCYVDYCAKNYARKLQKSLSEMRGMGYLQGMKIS
jgi:hypothetical protein